MNVLIGFDSLEASGYIFDDLEKAGLPADSNFLIVSATDIDPFPVDAERSIEELVVPDAASWQREISPDERAYLGAMLKNAQNYAREKEEETTRHAIAGADILRSRFPQAKVDYRVVMATPFDAISAQAHHHQADLIVVGSQNASGLSRFFLGSVSQKVVNFSSIPVRIARAQLEFKDMAPRVIVAFDGSADGRRAIDAVAARKWPEGTEVRVVTVEEPRSTGFFILNLDKKPAALGDSGDTGQLVETLAGSAAERLQQAGINAVPLGRTGDPKKVLLEEAEQWGADCIFLGAKGHKKPNAATLGAVAGALATRANCSLEIVR